MRRSKSVSSDEMAAGKLCAPCCLFLAKSAGTIVHILCDVVLRVERIVAKWCEIRI